jgi:flagellin
MSISLITNIASLNAQRNLETTTQRMGHNVGRLSSGLRIQTASDDAAGLGISENLKADLRSLAQAQRNANDAISMAQLAEGSLGEITDIVTRMRELAVQSANATLGSTERQFIQTEFVQLRSEIDRISIVTEFNGQYLLSGTLSAGVDFQIGIDSSTNDRIALSIGRVHSSTLGNGALKITGATLSTATGAQMALSVFDSAITSLSTSRANIGAVQNRVKSTISNLAVAFENLSAANSRIRDVDIAEESAALTRNQILNQAGVALLSQANQLPSAALSLIG